MQIPETNEVIHYELNGKIYLDYDEVKPLIKGIKTLCRYEVDGVVYDTLEEAEKVANIPQELYRYEFNGIFYDTEEEAVDAEEKFLGTRHIYVCYDCGEDFLSEESIPKKDERVCSECQRTRDFVERLKKALEPYEAELQEFFDGEYENLQDFMNNYM